MYSKLIKLGRTGLAFVVAGSLGLSGCSSETPPEATNQPTPAPVGSSAPANEPPVPELLEVTNQTWTPEALEDLLAPVALYPDDILGEVLVASTNPQEVLDAGTWRLKNETLEGNALDDAAKQAGFTPPVRMVLQNPVVLDMMCSEFGWTQELGHAYVNDQDGVLEAIQRLRRQAKNAGNLESSDKMFVETRTVASDQAIVLSSPDPDVVYVPQYDPEVVYVEHDDDDGVETETVVATALLAFGAGLALGAIFDDDDDDWYDDDYYYPSYYGPPMPYYAHYPYRPIYPGYYPARAYVRPAQYRYAYNNTTIVRRDVDNYWGRYDDRMYVNRDKRHTVSPITKARPNRPELQYLNEKSNRGPKRRAPAVTDERGSYQVKKKETAVRAGERKKAQKERRVADAGRGDRNRNPNKDVVKDRDRAGTNDRANRGGGGGKAGGGKGGAGKAGGGKGGAGKAGGGGDRARERSGTGGGGSDRPRAGGGGDRPKASGGNRGGRSGGDRPKAGGGGRGGGGGGGRRRG
jgi:hypothetical protein